MKPLVLLGFTTGGVTLYCTEVSYSLQEGLGERCSPIEEAEHTSKSQIPALKVIIGLTDMLMGSLRDGLKQD